MPAGGFGPLPLAEDTTRQTTGVARIRGPRWAHFPTLTIGLLGVQILWSVEMSYASSYLLSLGLTKSNMAIVFLAGPLSGFLIQPIIGVLADNSTSRWGRRRPFMLAGCFICAASMLLLGYTREFASIFAARGTPVNDLLTMWLAILSIYLADFAINAVSAVDRALLVDTLPPALQASGNAWAARMLGAGSVFGFFVGNLDLPSYLPFLGSSELQVLSVIVSVLLLSGHLTTAILVQEKVLVRGSDQPRSSLRAELRRLFSSMFTLPRVIQQICMIQFFAWLGWFPILFYTTMYISDLYTRTVPSISPFHTVAETAAEGTRLGSRALFFSAVLALLTNLVLPLFTRPSTALRAGHVRAESNVPLGIDVPEILKFPLSTLWAWSHLMFGACMLGTFFVSNVESAIFLIALTGVPWAVTQWVPFSLLAEAILTSTPKSVSPVENEAGPLLVSEKAGPEARLTPLPEDPLASAAHGQNTNTNLSAQAGVILGIHNVFIVIPQFLVTILCAVVFAIFETDATVLEASSVVPDTAATLGGGNARASTPVPRLSGIAGGRPNSIVYVFRLGALWSFIAFTICRRLGRELGR